MKKNIFSKIILLGAIAVMAAACGGEDPEKPRAIFSYEVNDLTVKFTNASSHADTYAWDFGDGKTSTEKNPEHTYAQNGTFKVTLTATGEGGVSSATEDVVVEKQAISIDGNFSDWDALGSAVASTTCANNTQFTALKSLKVYADARYLYLLVEFDDSQLVDKEWVPFHIYLDADNSNATGGYGDQYADANTEAMLEGAVFADGEPNSYDPAGFKWTGPVGGDGWLWGNEPADETNNWGAEFGEGSGVGKSATTGNKFEIAITLEMVAALLPNGLADTFGIGVDIQQEWTSVGVLPNLPNNDVGAAVKAPKLKVKVTK